MMKSKLKSISFENFKLFSEKIKVDFPTDSLFILDGPNGYGKTTCFDAIEILIKGERNREVSLDTTYKARNRSLPFVNNREKKIIIKGIFEVDGVERIYLREFEANSNKGVHQNIKEASKLYRIDNGENQLIMPEEMYQDLGLNSDGSNFNLLHYVQQEESTTFLKQSEKGRMDELGKLFNTAQVDDEIRKLAVVKKRVQKLINDLDKRLYESKQRKSSFSSDNKEIAQVPFVQLFNQLECSWDRQSYVFEDFKLVKEIMAELEELKRLVAHKDEFKTYRKNRQIINLAKKDKLLKLLLISPSILKKKEQIRKVANEVNKNQTWLQSKDESQKIKWLLEDQYAYAFEYINYSQDSFKQLQSSILEMKKKVNSSEKLLINLQQTREKLHGEHQRLLDKEETDHTSCPYCGGNYDIDALEHAYQLAKELYKGNDELAEKVLSMEKERNEQIMKFASQMTMFNEKHQGELLLNEWLEEGKGVQEKLESSKMHVS